MPEEKFEVLGRETVFEHPYVNVILEKVELPDGRVIPDWPIITTRDFVNAVVLNEDGLIMIQEGYKHGVGRSSWQVLGGYLEPNEDPAEAIKREMMEETGYSADDWQFLGTYVMDANRGVGTGYFYLARNAKQVANPNNDDLESFDLHWVTPAEAQAALGDGRVACASYAVNLALALLTLRLS